MLGPRVGYELPMTTHNQKVQPAPSPRERRENRLTRTRAEIPHGREVGIEEIHTEQGTPRAIGQANDPVVKRGIKLPKDIKGSIPSFIQIPEPRVTRPRAHCYDMH